MPKTLHIKNIGIGSLHKFGIGAHAMSPTWVMEALIKFLLQTINVQECLVQAVQVISMRASRGSLAAWMVWRAGLTGPVKNDS